MSLIFYQRWPPGSHFECSKFTFCCLTKKLCMQGFLFIIHWTLFGILLSVVIDFVFDPRWPPHSHFECSQTRFCSLIRKVSCKAFGLYYTLSTLFGTLSLGVINFVIHVRPASQFECSKGPCMQGFGFIIHY